MQSDEKRAEAITQYCIESGWVLPTFSSSSVRFLAAGEYNENWLLPASILTPQAYANSIQPSGNKHESVYQSAPASGGVQALPSGDVVFRINHGSQLGLENKQIAYEFRVLELLCHTNVTPTPYAVASPSLPIIDDSDCSSMFRANTPPATSFGNGVLTMAHLQGGPLQYEQHTEIAAQIFAATHSCPVPENHGLIVQADPVGDIVAECDGLLSRFADHPRKDVHRILCNYRDKVAHMGEEALPLFTAEPMVIANTEVNSGNFCIPRNSNDKEHGGAAGGLVDWEKAVVTCRYQDLGHFLTPTTTLWKTDYTYTEEGRRHFLSAYRKALLSHMETTGASDIHNVPDIEELLFKTNILERTILLRGLSWCYMAWHEYTTADRQLRHTDTFQVIERYLDEIEWFLQ